MPARVSVVAISRAAEKQGVDPAAMADAERRKSVILRVLEGLGQSGAAGAAPGGPMWAPDDATELAQSHDRRALIRATIHETAAYLKTFYDVERELPTQYDLVVNTEVLDPDEAADLIARAAGA